MANIPNERNIIITEEYKNIIKNTLLSTIFHDEAYVSSDVGKADIDDHISGRMIDVQNTVLPWLEEAYDIKGKSILEIGCGTGSATAPFALKADRVDAYDISSNALEVAMKRAALLGVDNIDFHLLDSCWAQSSSKVKDFFANAPKADVILLMAVLEHLTIDERINLLKGTWDILEEGNIIIIYETPNRLSFFDWHSFLLPFFDSLPDQLALLYAHKTPREFFTDHLKGDVEELYRFGRGVSYHEFELSLNFSELSVINDGFSSYLKQRVSSSHPMFDEVLLEIFDKYLPHIPKGFICPSLDLIIQKCNNPIVLQRNEQRKYVQELKRENSVREVVYLKQQLSTAQAELETVNSQIESINRSLLWKLTRKMQNYRIYRFIARIVRYLYYLNGYK
ncbi:MAG: class I SAM-dependent methyltransferase [Deltaproteobacteria bacterium]|nr:class I SAM-dependent methyltransferase [Deltaproteobacteria bacterium]